MAALAAATATLSSDGMPSPLTLTTPLAASRVVVSFHLRGHKTIAATRRSLVADFEETARRLMSTMRAASVEIANALDTLRPTATACIGAR